MHLSYKSLLALSLFCLNIAFAGNEVGNGGNAVVCPKRVELLDIYEAGILRRTKVDPSLKGSDPFQIAKERLALLSEADPKSVKIYEAELERLKKEISFEDELVLKPIDDSLHAFEPKEKGCKITQLAVFRKKPLPGEKLVLVEKTIWQRMSPIHQAGLLLHEAIYKHLSDLGEKDSSKARYLVSYVLSEAFSKKDTESYWQLIQKMRLPIYR